MKTKIAFYTLGCKLNFSETSSISNQLNDNGFEQVSFASFSNIYVINTCSVTENADKKCRQVVKQALKKNKDGFVVIIGCYAQLKPKEITEIPGVDLVLGASEKFNLMHHLSDISKKVNAGVFNTKIKEVQEFIPSFSSNDRTRMFLKVQDGCDYFCTFCTIPLARGKSRSRNVADTVKFVENATKNGVQEVVLTGINLGDFGIDFGENFYDLIVELDNIETVKRYRISSIEPNLLSKKIIEFVANSQKFMPHFHIPLQSGSDDILVKMKRKYNTQLYKSRIELIKEKMPHCCIGVDVLTGFPTEDNDEFLKTYNLLNELDISYLHVFPYSERERTTANKMKGVVPVHIRKERADMLRILSEKKKRAFYEQQKQGVHRVLFEHEEKAGMMEGYSENYIRVSIPYNVKNNNKILPIMLTNLNTKGIFAGEIAKTDNVPNPI